MLLNFVERVGSTVVLPPVDDDWGGGTQKAPAA